jgi:hypothetical protein
MSHWDLFFGLCFVTLVIIIIADYNDISNVQFVFTAIAFIAYLIYLRVEYTMENSCLFDKYTALPTKISKMINSELDQYLKVMSGMKDVMGKDPVEQTVDETVFVKNNDPTITSGGVVQLEAFSNLRGEYYTIDKVFRDLLMTNSNLYIEKVYNPGSALP